MPRRRTESHWPVGVNLLYLPSAIETGGKARQACDLNGGIARATRGGFGRSRCSLHERNACTAFADFLGLVHTHESGSGDKGKTKCAASRRELLR
jgi:hypothetical protein